MKKVIIFILIVLLVLPSAFCWRWETHEVLVENFYDNIPKDMQENLNLSLMKVGSTIPDKIFMDNHLHHYPLSLPLAKDWLDFAKKEYSSGHYGNASLAFGIASHYISDSFVAPHYAATSWSLHEEFEKQVTYYIPKISCERKFLDLDQILQIASQNKNDWQLWLKNKNKTIPEREVDQAMEVVFDVGLETFNTSCIEKTIIGRSVITKLGIALTLGILVVVFIILRPVKRF